jgi:Response regulator containing CheY-like receiver, AAA-type ATPase, and DNA-binding domains
MTQHEQREDGQESPDDSSSYVLVVDDEPVVRDFLKRCLEGWGYSVKQAGSAAEALECMMARPASVVLCDIKMPDHDGLWLAEQLRARWPDTAVVMTTATDNVETIAKSRELGAVDYLTKPIAPEQLLQAVRRVTSPPDEDRPMSAADSPSSPLEELQAQLGKIEAEYTLECPVRCPTCGETVTYVKAIRLLRAKVNFTSTLPRRGRLVACPHCLAVIPAELSNF